jgi:predicted homoserine dehydrogenase-like protein
MNLAAMLAEREERHKPVRLALIGAGKFGTMILAQLRLMRGVQLVALADLDVARAREAAVRAGWERERFTVVPDANGANDLARTGKTALLASGEAATECEVDIVIEATGYPEAATLHAYRAIEAGRHVIMVTVEADVVVGPMLYRHARKHGVIYSLAYGDQPAIVCELVDWARTCGFDIVAAGKGTKYHPDFKRSTPETALGHHGFTPEQIAQGGFNPKMFNSFLDGTKQSIEMVAIANATGLHVPENDLVYTPCSVYELATFERPRADGGVLERAGIVDVVSSIDAQHREIPNNLRFGMFVTFTSQEPYSLQCLTQYGVATDPSGKVGAMWRPYHLIGLELGVSIASVALRGEATGAPAAGHIGEVVCGTRKAMKAGETIDGEGGYAVYGMTTSAARARRERLIPMGLAQGLKLTRDVPADHLIGEGDVEFDDSSFMWKLRREQERAYDPPAPVKVW